MDPREFSETLEKLIGKFVADKSHYLSKGYSEAQARIDFITPLFKALGWDVENQAGLPHHAREVLVEGSEAETLGKPDYSFRLHGQTKFFVEAKAPCEPLDAARHIMQAKGYAWNTRQVFFVILTDFEEFRFYDASIQPDERKPDEGLLLKLKYDEYSKSLEKLWEFSKERVAAGSLDAMLPRDRRTQRLRIPVDEAFLDEMTGWREDLARNVYKNNPSLTAKQLNEVVQRLLDRIVFIRIAEDRRIIENYQLRRAVEEWQARGGKFHIFDWLNDLFHRINEDFNGEIFKPHLSETIKVDSEVLAKIIERLYPPKSPYRFDVIGVELLGSIYERYLGKTIRPTAKQVRVEEKPEVRKAGGVYYTPKYIVDYIVKNTAGKVIEGKTPRQIEKIRILDPACGSGSFLIGAFQYLIDYHVRYLTEHPKEAHIHPLFPDLIKGENGEPRLSVIRKARILRNNLFGVDIDPQAVEITMMSLYLKALEGEKSQLPPKHALLPELKYNIVCGNSLIGPDIYDQGTLFGDEERERINAFDWYGGSPPVILSPDAFGRGEESAVPGRALLTADPSPKVRAQGDKPGGESGKLPSSLRRGPGGGAAAPTIPDIMRSGGFDCVIGNPPYVRIQHMKEWAPVEVEFYKEHYKSASSGNYDIYVVFVEKGLSVLNKNGKLGFIVPHKFFNSKYGEPLREVISKGRHLSSVVHFGDQQVFEGATNYTCLLFLDKDGNKQFEFEKVEDLGEWRETGKATKGTISASRATGTEWNFTVGKGAALFERLSKMPTKLGDIADIFVGLQTSADDVFILDLIEKKPKTLRLESKALNEEVTLEKGLLFPLISGTDVRRYTKLPERQYIIFPYHVADERPTLIPLAELRNAFPKTADYLFKNRKRLEEREGGRFRGHDWYRFGRSQNIGIQGRPKACVPRLVDRLHAAYDGEGAHYLDNVDAGGITLKNEYEEHALPYVVGLLNSRLLAWYFPFVSAPFRGGYLSANRQFLSQLPIRPINFSDPADKARHDRMVGLVERMLELHRGRGPRARPGRAPTRGAPTVAAMSSSSPVGGEDAAATELDREIAATDRAIDDLVYELYGITDDERKIIQGNG